WELVYTGVTPHVNAIYDHFFVAQRKDYVPTATIIDIMSATNDPRLPLYATLAPDTTVYIGMEYGIPGGDAYQNYSHLSDQLMGATWPAVMIDYPEVQFLLAEAAQRGYATPMTAEEHYNAGVTASVVAWGGDAADAATFLTNDVPYDAVNWKESLGTQKWVALFNRGVEGWAEWRKFDFPVLHTPEELLPTDIPMRMPYPFNEKDLNGTNYTSAAAAIGGDDVRTLLFWDVTPNAK
ncbi:MAG: SusD/RagB family nutrient-binding outer membrane lipoprotein, partial [Bacteroidales bacterium]|nr:SusD/RagB family nutrient-binding outer membrane lipoprotein [Bacteroidales bacterium]